MLICLLPFSPHLLPHPRPHLCSLLTGEAWSPSQRIPSLPLGGLEQGACRSPPNTLGVWAQKQRWEAVPVGREGPGHHAMIRLVWFVFSSFFCYCFCFFKQSLVKFFLQPPVLALKEKAAALGVCKTSKNQVWWCSVGFFFPPTPFSSLRFFFCKRKILF